VRIATRRVGFPTLSLARRSAKERWAFSRFRLLSWRLASNQHDKLWLEMPDNTKIKLLNFLVALRRLPPLSDLSGEEERILFALREIWERKGTLSVSDVYDLGEAKSASTSYRLLMGLKDKGLVDISVDDTDKRKRDVQFTSAANKLFQALS